MDILKSSLMALLASLFCIWLSRPLAVKLGFVDRPSHRKWHEKEIPLIGGIAIYFGFCLALLTLSVSLQPYRGMLAGSSILLLMGVVDDFKDLSSKLRLFGQVIAALLLIIWGKIMLTQIGDLFFLGNLQLGLWAIPITVLVVVANINAMNMVDGQDGLAGSVALGQAILLALVSLQLHREIDFHLLTILIVLVVVFLSFNMRFPWRKQASIFMGDSGSTFIAFILSWLAVDLSQSNVSMVKPITLLWIMAFPIYDLINVIVLRIRQKKPVLSASHDHFHHVLHVAGLNTTLSTLLLCTLSLFLGILGLILNYFSVSEGWQFLLWLAMLLFYIYIVELTRKPINEDEPDIVYDT